jgi:hypothetical protein
MMVNGRMAHVPIIQHQDIADGGEIVFEMSEKVEEWGNELLVRSHLFHFKQMN